MTLAQDIKDKALQLGFDLVGITDVSPLDSEQFEFFTDWLALGFAAQMDYIRNNLDKRTNPAKLLKNAQSVICLALNYTPPPSGPSLRARHDRAKQSQPTGTVANYAQYEDYHHFIKKQLRQLTDFISSITDENVELKICVDSVPLAERALAARAGLGFIGKNHMLINPRLGSKLFLAEIVTTLELPPDKPLKLNCANCKKCLDACPAGALRCDGQFDANKCISYLTIEYKGDFPPDLAGKIGNHLFGCDECVLACPHNANAPVCKNKEFRFFPDRAELNLRRILDMTEDEFEIEFADSPFLRLGLDRLKRNARTCLDNLHRRI